MLLALFSVKFVSKTFLIGEDDINGPSFRQAFIVSIDGKQLFKSNWCTFLIKNQPKKDLCYWQKPDQHAKKHPRQNMHVGSAGVGSPTYWRELESSGCASMGCSTQPLHSCHWPAGSILPNAAPSARSICKECPQLGRRASMGWESEPAWHW